jgi:sulfate adenylyltransferase
MEHLPADYSNGNAPDLVWDLTGRQLCDLELLLNGAFAPLTGFLGRADYESVLARMRLSDGTLWPMPVMLDVTREFAADLAPGTRIALRDAEGLLLAHMTVRERWQPDLDAEAHALNGAPGHGLQHTNPVYLAGDLHPIAAPTHYDFQHLRLTPAQTRAAFAQSGWRRVMAAPLIGLPTIADADAVLAGASGVNARVLIQPIVGQSALRYLAPGDLDHYARLRCYELVMKRWPPDSAMMALLPLASRCASDAPPAARLRELLWRAIVHKNHGCTHVLLSEWAGLDLAQLLANAREIGVEFVTIPTRANTISQAQLRASLERGERLPASVLYPEVAAELHKRYRPRLQRGFTLFFTGLSGSGKSTIARALLAKLMELGTRSVTLLDGDLVRKHLSSELGFSREHRNINIQRIGYVASEITKHGGIAICAPIAPYTEMRRAVRAMISEYGGFYEIYVSTPLEVCEARDRKGLYAKARAGIVKEFTGVSDPYETPQHAELVIDTQYTPVQEALTLILERLQTDGYLPAPDQEMDYSI